MNRVVYFSRGGNTKKLAEAIAKGAGASIFSVEQFKTTDSLDILYVGASIYAGSINGKLRQFLAGLKPAQVKCVIVFGTSAGKRSALSEVKSILEPHGIAVSDEIYHSKVRSCSPIGGGQTMRM